MKGRQSGVWLCASPILLRSLLENSKGEIFPCCRVHIRAIINKQSLWKEISYENIF